ncbi:MAG: bifunctional (p)ppGpp synthetase/guanosine-3',5'-bis(diphosphate) 3'-pyrophosphohydrolase [Candidatus Diapherotrites archaeon]|nr:bifunctional (p)ppGpp synthetase/guanosine-3',5'-bis(diphosphate) 3'-pyrophosphohydrolase [Candidatus Diapherotrites archaeon]
METLDEVINHFPKREQQQILLANTFINERLNQKLCAHALRTAKILTTKGLSIETVVAGILHDTIYQSDATYTEIEQIFGTNVANVVKEASIIEKLIETNFPQLSAETVSSLILSTSSDLQTIMIQMAELTDILESGGIENKYGKRLIRVVKEIYVPLSLKLGLGRSNWQLEDDCFEMENKNAFHKIRKLVNKTREDREELIEKIKKEVTCLLKNKVAVQISGRPKNFYAIHKKMKNVTFKNIHDLYGLRIICNKDKECYEVLGYVHSKYDFLPNAFDDYIAKPKKNGYKSIHTAVKYGKDIIEFQIRTWEQHLRIESNLYWEYKKLKQNREFGKTLSWERQLIEWQKSLGEEVTSKRKYSRKVFIFTPKSEVISLPKGASVIDFAFAIHSDVGKKMQKAKVNGIIVPLETQLENLDKVEIILANKPQIKESWINYVKSEKAKSKIKQYFGVTKSIKKEVKNSTKTLKKIKIADCCNPLPGEDVVGIKTTKRKIIIHKKDCKNLKNIALNKLVEIAFEENQGKSKIVVSVIDRIGLLGEVLKEIKKSNGRVLQSNFNIKKSGYVEAEFILEIKGIKKLENLMERIAKIPSVQSIERK